MESKISRERAEEIFQDFLDYYDLSIDDVSEDERNAFPSGQRKIIKSIMNGTVEIETEEGYLVTQHLKNGSKIEYKEITGKSKLQMDKQKGNFGKVYALLGSLSGLGAKPFSDMKGKDISIAETLGFFFLMV